MCSTKTVHLDDAVKERVDPLAVAIRRKW